jgi:hypothetical protein
MSNVFQALVRDTGGLIPMNIGVGVITDPVSFQGLNIDSTGAVYAILDGVIDHHASGLPFDVDGRLVVSNAAVSYFDQSIPFTATGAMALGGGISHYNQSLAYDGTSKLSTTALLVGAFSSAFSIAFDTSEA